MVETAASHKDQIHSNQALAKVLLEKAMNSISLDILGY